MSDPAGVIRFGELVGRTEMLEVACDKCGRFGRYRVSKLIEEHGERQGIPEWLYSTFTLACPEYDPSSIYKQCRAHCPQLPALFPAEPRNEKGPRREPRA